ncbi:MAG: nitroreductase family protein [Candidatus Thorarchaeota archaeon]|nr:nitroreductase family protein [Candidatus Thorarchaeota archaeon]
MFGLKHKDIFQIMHDRRSIRSFLDKPISKEVLDKILEAGFRAPFAAQLCSVVYTRDKEKAKSLSIGVYSTAPVFLVFFVDFVRLEKIMKARGYENTQDDMMSLWLGIQDVSLVVENVTLAAEAMGLGSVLLGATPMRARKISELFGVPDRVFPVVGMCIGYPDESDETEIRPRFPLKYNAFEDQYSNHSSEDIQECMKAMDEGYLAQGYYIKKRIKVPLLEGEEDGIGFDRYSWSEHISRKFRRRGESNPLFGILKKQGFVFDE